MVLMNFHTFIFRIGLRNHQDRIVVGKKMHDNYIVEYSMNFEQNNIVIKTHNNTKGKRSDISFSEVLTHSFRCIIDYNIISDIEEREIGDSIVERATGCPVIIIDNVYDEKTVEEAAIAFGEWISNMEHKNGGGADFRMFHDEDYSMINEFNYKEYYGKEILWISVSIDSSGTISTQRY